MKDVAHAAGVSSAAVSYAYTRPDKLSRPQRERILKVAADLGYLGPHPGAASLRRGKVGAIGLMITDSLPYAFEDPATVLLLQGIAQVGELAEVALTFMPFPSVAAGIAKGGAREDAARLAMQVLVDGFLVYSLPDSHPAVAAAQARNLPTVIIDSPQLADVPFVGIADAKGAKAAAEHLLELGHEEFAILVDRLIPDGTVGIVDAPRVRHAQDAVGRTRVRTYLKTLKDGGIPAENIHIVEAGGFLVHDTQRAVDVLLTIPDVTAVLASTDLLALTLLDSCQARGIDVPGDLSIIGYDNLPAARAVGLTTVEQPLVDKGRIAAELLMELLGGGEGRRVVLPTRLEVGRTAAGPGRGLPGL